MLATVSLPAMTSGHDPRSTRRRDSPASARRPRPARRTRWNPSYLPPLRMRPSGRPERRQVRMSAWCSAGGKVRRRCSSVSTESRRTLKRSDEVLRREREELPIRQTSRGYVPTPRQGRATGSPESFRSGPPRAGTVNTLPAHRPRGSEERDVAAVGRPGRIRDRLRSRWSAAAAFRRRSVGCRCPRARRRPRSQANASWLPSGDNAGFVSAPDRLVMGTTIRGAVGYVLPGPEARQLRTTPPTASRPSTATPASTASLMRRPHRGDPPGAPAVPPNATASSAKTRSRADWKRSRALLEAVPHECFEGHGNLAGRLGERRGILAQDRRHGLRLGPAPRTAGFPRASRRGSRPKREDVRAVVRRLRRGPAPATCSPTVPRTMPGSVPGAVPWSSRRRRPPARGRRQLRQAEVEDLDAPVPRDEEVLGLQVAVDDPLLVRGGQARARSGARSRSALRGGQRPAAERARAASRPRAAPMTT